MHPHTSGQLHVSRRTSCRRLFRLHGRHQHSTLYVVACATSVPSSGNSKHDPSAPRRVLLLGGAGRIGTAAAIHLLRSSSNHGALHVELAGRSEARGRAAVEEVEREVGAAALRASGHRVSFTRVNWLEPGALASVLAGPGQGQQQQQPPEPPLAVLHTAGPFDEDASAGVLREVIRARVPAYVDVADPLDYLAAAKRMGPDAAAAGTCAVVSAGAFPGFSNVLAVECARRLQQQQQQQQQSSSSSSPIAIRDVRFSYFTAGLGGSGNVNLLITNLGFGQPVPTFRDGVLQPQMMAGASSSRVDFFLDKADPAFKAVGSRDVWPWPFPEAATVASHLRITGSSDIGMGTAPGIWNTVLVGLVALVPRHLWRQRWFSEGLAWFSLPMVWVADRVAAGGETHAMRVDVTAEDGRRCVAVQAHQSFRRCVGASAAEFLLELLDRRVESGGGQCSAAGGSVPGTELAAGAEAGPVGAAAVGMGSADSSSCTAQKGASGIGSWRPGVWLPEELADDDALRSRLLQRLSAMEGTVSCNMRVL